MAGADTATAAGTAIAAVTDTAVEQATAHVDSQDVRLTAAEPAVTPAVTEAEQLPAADIAAAATQVAASAVAVTPVDSVVAAMAAAVVDTANS